jgi:hypothetical protein
MTSASASIAGGVLDSVSAGILLYAATVELMVCHPCSHGVRIELMVGTRIRLQSLLPHLLLETVDIRHYLFRIRDRFNVVIG